MPGPVFFLPAAVTPHNSIVNARQARVLLSCNIADMETDRVLVY
jgi:hypothetical protein